MRDDELLAIYTATRQIAEAMAARDAELKKSTAALEATIIQVRQLQAILGQQTGKYIAAGIREVVQEDFSQPIENALKEPLFSLDLALRHATTVVSEFKGVTRYLTWTWFAIVLAMGFGLGSFGTYFFFTREVGKLRDQIDAMQQQVAPPVVPVASPAPPPVQTKKKHEQH